ncbi:VENN motif pre-toxin domain-containing protein, partial [Faucicola atlantae]|uniref:VENN motif pre-toxin domain-containing protein n=1 Tax=Faucicola atlantae TaxID=34059 RepID=UPI001560805C
LSADEKATVSSITSLAGLGMGATTGDVASAVSAGETAKVAVEDNSQLFDDARSKTQEFFQRAAQSSRELFPDTPAVSGFFKGLSDAADGTLAISDASLETLATAIHCASGGSYCEEGYQNNVKRAEALEIAAHSVANGEVRKQLTDWAWNLKHGTPAQQKKAAEQLARVSTSLGMSGIGTKGTRLGNSKRIYSEPNTQSIPDSILEFRYNNPQVYREYLAKQAGIPRNISVNPEILWGKSVDQIKQSFEMDGATVTRKPQRGTSNAIVYKVEGHASGIKEFEFHPGGGAHTADNIEYYKIVKKDGTEVRIFDPSKPFNSGTITPKQKYLDPQGNEYIKRNGQWVKK